MALNPIMLLVVVMGGAMARTVVQLDMPPRFQWSNAGGYCGETSLQMALLYNGAWVSQYVARAAGGGGQEEQLLLPS
jgi:hypothetical protein